MYYNDYYPMPGSMLVRQHHVLNPIPLHDPKERPILPSFEIIGVGQGHYKMLKVPESDMDKIVAYIPNSAGVSKP
jgi:hypothetical protein